MRYPRFNKFPRRACRDKRGTFMAAGRSFRSNVDGNVAILFTLATVPMLALIGAAVDYGIANRDRVKLQAATDATALALCQASNTAPGQLRQEAKKLMEGYMGRDDLTINSIASSGNPREVSLKTQMTSKTYFGKFTNVANVNPTATATCTVGQTFEIALVLDNTGSMAASSNGQTKLQAAQTAATNFVNYVNSTPTFSPATRISIVPFAASVAVDPNTYRSAHWIDRKGESALHWTNVLNPGSKNFQSRFDIFNKLKHVAPEWDWAGCLETLPYPLNVQDGSPSSDPNTLYVPLFAPDEPGDGSTLPQTNNGYTSFNSYLRDYTDDADCPQESASFSAAEGRACKYVNAVNASPTNSSALGVPNGPNFGCTTKPLQRLTGNMSTLKNLISSMAPQGSTNIHEGVMWGWRTLSPNSVFGDGSAYSNSKIQKVMIVMTDGANSWGVNPGSLNKSLYLSMGYIQNADGSTPNPRLPPGNQNVSGASSARNALDALTLQACNNAKATGISVWTIGFSTPEDPIDSTGLNLLTNCASTRDQAFVANDSNSLISTFDEIARKMGELRLTH